MSPRWTEFPLYEEGIGAIIGGSFKAQARDHEIRRCVYSYSRCQTGKGNLYTTVLY